MAEATPEGPKIRAVELADSADETLATIFRTHYGALVGLARLLGDNRDAAEEMVQEAFARTYAAWPRVRDRRDPVGYLRTVVVNLARDNLRRRTRARRSHLLLFDVVPSAEVTAMHGEQVSQLAEQSAC